MNALIVDHDEHSRSQLREIIKQEKDCEIVGECATAKDALRMMSSSAPDVIFTESETPDLNGLELIHSLRGEKGAQIVLVTANNQFALHAFDAAVLDYILKPFSADRVRKSLQRVRDQIAKSDLVALNEKVDSLVRRLKPERRYPERLLFKGNGKFALLDVHEVCYFMAQGNYVLVHLKDRSYLWRQTMSNLESRLDPEKFLRIHRSTIVNLNSVKEIRPWVRPGISVAVLQDGTKLNMGRAYLQKLETLRHEFALQ